MTEKMQTVSSFCWRCFQDAMTEKFGNEIQITNQNFTSDGVLDLGVNWSSMGTKDPSEAASFAAKLAEAAAIAASSPLNGAQVIYKY